MRNYYFTSLHVDALDEAFDEEGNQWFEGEEIVLDKLNGRPMADLIDDGFGGFISILRTM